MHTAAWLRTFGLGTAGGSADGQLHVGRGDLFGGVADRAVDSRQGVRSPLTLGKVPLESVEGVGGERNLKSPRLDFPTGHVARDPQQGMVGHRRQLVVHDGCVSGDFVSRDPLLRYPLEPKVLAPPRRSQPLPLTQQERENTLAKNMLDKTTNMMMRLTGLVVDKEGSIKIAGRTDEQLEDGRAAGPPGLGVRELLGWVRVLPNQVRGVLTWPFRQLRQPAATSTLKSSLEFAWHLAKASVLTELCAVGVFPIRFAAV